MKLWSTYGTSFKTFSGHEGVVYCCAFSPTEKYVVSGSLDNTLQVWSVESGKSIQKLEGHENGVRKDEQ